MLKKWIKYLCDPIDKSPLRIDKLTKSIGDDIISGILISKSGNSYKIVEGVPILLNRYTQSVKSVDSFAYEWENFDFDYGKKGWLKDIVKPVLGGTKYFKNKIVMDCGAGSGRQSLWMAEAGAKFVFSVELSDSARSMVKKVTEKYNDKVFVIQADIAHLPIKKKTAEINVAYCVNVIQHTKNPMETTREISKLLNKESEFIFNIYLEKGRRYFLTFLNFVRAFTKRIPHITLKFISFLTAFFCTIFALLPYLSRWFRKSLPIEHGFEETWLAIYDILGGHEHQKFYTENELQNILKNSGLRTKKRSKYALVLVKIK